MSSHFVAGLSRLNLSLSKNIIEKELRFLDELLRWNQRVNLTSIRTRDKAIEKHLLDSLLLLPHLENKKKIMDMGSGGGLPGIPLAIADATILVTSIDSVGKKINFQKHIKRLLCLDNLSIQQARMEELTAMELEYERYDLVVSRAFASLDLSIQHAAAWLGSGGRLLAMKGPEGEGELALSAQAREEYNFTKTEVITYKLPFSGAVRQLVILEK